MYVFNEDFFITLINTAIEYLTILIIFFTIEIYANLSSKTKENFYAPD